MTQLLKRAPLTRDHSDLESRAASTPPNSPLGLSSQEEAGLAPGYSSPETVSKIHLDIISSLKPSTTKKQARRFALMHNYY